MTKVDWRPQVKEQKPVKEHKPVKEQKPVRVPKKTTAPKAKPAPQKQTDAPEGTAANPIILHQAEGSRYVIFIDEYEGKQVVNLRQQYKRKDSDTWLFSPKGITTLASTEFLRSLHRAAKVLNALL